MLIRPGCTPTELITANDRIRSTDKSSSFCGHRRPGILHQHETSHRICVKHGPVCSRLLAKGLGIEPESSQRSLPVECPSQLRTKAAQTDRSFSTCSPPWVVLSVRVLSYATQRSRNLPSKGTACASVCSGRRTRRGHRPEKPPNRRFGIGCSLPCPSRVAAER